MRSADNATVKFPSMRGYERLQMSLRFAEQAACSAIESGELAADLAPGLQAVEFCLNGGCRGCIADRPDDLLAAAAKS